MSDNQFYYGAFLSLKAQSLVSPDDSDDYSQLQSDIFSKQAVTLLFGLFWARMYELGRFKWMIPNRILYYGIVVGLPSITHAFWVSNKLTQFSQTLDTKYQNQYIQYLNQKKLSKQIITQRT